MGIGVDNSSSVDWTKYENFGANSSFGVAPTNDGQYQLFSDPDGVGGEEGAPVQVVDEATLNAILAANGAGFKFVNGVRVESDTVDRVSGPGGDSSYDLSDHPLPGVDDGTGTGTMTQKAAWLQNFEGASDAALLWLGLMATVKSNRDEMVTARLLKNLGHEQKIALKSNEIDANVAKIEAEKDAAALQFYIALGCAVVTVAAAGIGAASGASATTVSSVVQVTSACTSAVSAGGKWLDKEFGPQAEADRKQIEAQRYQALQEMVDASIDDLKGAYDEAKEQWKGALKIISDHYDQQLQTTSKIFS